MPAHHAFWPKRLPYQLTAPQTSLWMNLQISALRYPQKVALVFMGKTWTYSELQFEAEKIASALRKMGVQKGDRVVLDMQNCPQLVMTHFAILRLDAVVVPSQTEAMVEAAPVVARREAAAPALRGPVPARLRAQLPNGVTLELECGGRDGALVKAMIEALGAR